MIAVKLDKDLGEFTLDVEFRLAKGSFLAVAGPSGSGKTTLLRILAGLEEARGSIEVEGEIWLDDRTYLPPQKRSIGFVFQEYALFPSMRVIDNLLYVQNDPTLARRLLALTHIDDLADRPVTRLSGGQKQRVALARAMMRRPKLLLMDEPLSALDPDMRMKLQDEILTLHREFGTTTVMVSHDPAEIYRLADWVVTLERGTIQKDGSPESILLQTAGSQKLALHGRLLDIVKKDVVHVAIVAVGQQIVEVVLSNDEAKRLRVGHNVRLGIKAFAPLVETSSQTN